MAPLDGSLPKEVASPIVSTSDDIRIAHRERRFMMKSVQKMDRSLEAFVRFHRAGYNPNAPEAERAASSKRALAIIKQARASETHPDHRLVAGNDTARGPFAGMQASHEGDMSKLAQGLPAYSWVKSVKGFGALGFATIVGETGDLNNYPTHKHVWSRCGYAPYGAAGVDERPLAGSTWKRGPKWAGRSLSAEEWTAHPFKGERYSLFQQIGENLLKHQLISKTKTESGCTEAKGYYGQIYVDRRAFTAANRPDWSPMRCKRDAERIVMKALLEDVWRAWRGEDVDAVNAARSTPRW